MPRTCVRRLGSAAAVLALSAASLVGCGSVAPGEARKTLQLTVVAGSPPPAEVYEEVVVPEYDPPWLLELVVSSGSLVIDAEGSYEHRLAIETLENGRIVGRNRWADRGLWTETERGLAFVSGWIEGHAFTGARAGERVAVEFDLHPFTGTHATVALVFGE